MLPDPEARRLDTGAFFAAHLPQRLAAGAELLVTPDLDGAALWLPPGMDSSTPPPASGRPEVIALLEAVDAAHPRRPHWYLEFLGARQAGGGRGSALLRNRFESSDAAGVPTALWTGAEANLVFYGRHGYQVIDRLEAPGATAWWLWRDPS